MFSRNNSPATRKPIALPILVIKVSRTNLDISVRSSTQWIDLILESLTNGARHYFFVALNASRLGRNMLGKKWKMIGLTFLTNIFLPNSMHERY